MVLIGFSGSRTYTLRPIVSINLRTSGYNLEKVVNKDKTVSFNLIKSQ